MTHSSAQLKQMARIALNGKWGSAAVFTFFYLIIAGGLLMITSLFASSKSFIGTLIFLIADVIISLIISLFSAGSSYYFLNICRGRQYKLNDLFAAFRMSPDRFLIVSLITSAVSLISTIPTYFWTPTEDQLVAYSLIMLICVYTGLIITLIISLYFALSTFLLLDFPELGAIDSLRMSAYLMKGHKGRYLYISFSFVGWVFLSLFSFGIALLWIEPYMNMTFTYFYEDILTQTNKRQKEELAEEAVSCIKETTPVEEATPVEEEPTEHDLADE